MTNSKTTQPTSTIVQVPATAAIDVTSPAVLKLVEQGGTIATVFLGCVFLYLVIELIKVVKDD